MALELAGKYRLARKIERRRVAEESKRSPESRPHPEVDLFSGSLGRNDRFRTGDSSGAPVAIAAIAAAFP
jgi:hypothetical protein